MLDETQILCPYCGETLDVLIDTSAGSQHYIEDCQVCCKPIEFQLKVEHDGSYRLQTGTGDNPGMA